MSSNGAAVHIRHRKVEKIFRMFDVNQDDGLNRQEMAALVIAVNPRVKFSEEQILNILDEVFRTYGDYIDGDKGLSYEGLLRTYDDGAGDVDRDFVALKLQLDNEGRLGEAGQFSAPRSILDERPEVASSTRRRPDVGQWANSPNNGVACEATWDLIVDLETLLKRLEGGSRSSGSRGSFDAQGPKTSEQNAKYADFKNALSKLRLKAESNASPDEVFDAHMAIGRVLFDHGFYAEALISFQKAIDSKPADLRPHFRAGNCLYSIGRFPEARVEYQKALDAGQANGQESSLLLPQVRVNLGIALEAEGMLLGACEQYREAAILNSNHYRALKHLGSALLGVGEYRAAQKALENAVYIKHEYADAHCDLGSVLHALKEDDKAIDQFRIAIDQQPNHIEAFYNLGGVLRDIGQYGPAADMYSKVLAINPDHWQSQLNRAVALLANGEVEEAKKAFKAAKKMTNRVELYDELQSQKHYQKKARGPALEVGGVGGSSDRQSAGDPTADAVQVVEPSRFRIENEKTTERVWLASALEIRAIQKQARLNLCDVSVVSSVLSDGNLPLAPGTSYEEKVIRKPELEKVLRQQVLPSLSADIFQGAIKVLNERVLGVLDRSGTGRVDLGYFFAIISPICAGSVENRKRTVFDCLLWRTPKTSPGEIPLKDCQQYMDHLRAVFLPSQGMSNQLEVRPPDEQAYVSYPEFVELFDEPNWGFGILYSLLKLESTDSVRQRSFPCTVCSYTIVGPRFREVTEKFNLCSQCYAQGKVPATSKQDEFCFKEYSSSSAGQDIFNLFG